MTDTDKPVAVTQADREISWDHRADCYGHKDRAGWLRGQYDHTKIIQDFKRHREQAERDTIAGSAGHDAGATEQVGCNYCGAQVLLMGADYLDEVMKALDVAGAPRKSPDGMVHYSIFERIRTLSTPPTPGIDAGRLADLLKRCGSSLDDFVRHLGHKNTRSGETHYRWASMPTVDEVQTALTVLNEAAAALSPKGDA